MDFFFKKKRKQILNEKGCDDNENENLHAINYYYYYN